MLSPSYLLDITYVAIYEQELISIVILYAHVFYCKRHLLSRGLIDHVFVAIRLTVPFILFTYVFYLLKELPIKNTWL